jgi:hypothetical protein
MAEDIRPFFISGPITVRGKCAFGHLLFTPSFLFALGPDDEAAVRGARGFGMLGFFIGSWFDSKRVKHNPPRHLTIPEIAALEPKLQKKLLKTKLLCSIPLNSGLTAKPEGTGYAFFADGYPKVTYQAILHRRRLFKFLQERAIPVT